MSCASFLISDLFRILARSQPLLLPLHGVLPCLSQKALSGSESFTAAIILSCIPFMPDIYSCDDADEDISDIFISECSAEIAGRDNISITKSEFVIFI